MKTVLGLMTVSLMMLLFTPASFAEDCDRDCGTDGDRIEGKGCVAGNSGSSTSDDVTNTGGGSGDSN